MAAHPSVGDAGTALTQKDFTFAGKFDRLKLEPAFLSELKGQDKFHAKSYSNFLELLEFMEVDKDVSDIRWMAYMFATAHWEAAYFVTSTVPARDKKGRPIVSKSGKPVLKSINTHRSMFPVRETGRGKGRRYERPVKVTKNGDGSATVVEQDGDVFTVFGTGKSTLHARGANADAKQGVLPTATVSDVYTKATGDELAYYGRGYVQLTWWENYASTGAAIGLGLDLLFDPDRALEPKIAYQVMCHGMRTGSGFANGRKFAHYFQGDKADYLGARAMVNGSDRAAEIAVIAKRFEAVLLTAKQR